MRFHWFSLVIVLCAMPLISPAGEKKADNPFKTAKIGDYIAYKVTSSVDGKDIGMFSIKRTVTAKNEKELTLQTASTVADKSFPAKEAKKFDLTKPYDPIAAKTAEFKEGKLITGEGKEKVKIGDKTYDCTWISYKGVVDKKLEVEGKFWFDKSVPLTGLVKWEVRSEER